MFKTKTNLLIIIILEVRSSKRIIRAAFLLEMLRENTVPFLFPLLGAAYIPWLVALSSIFKASSQCGIFQSLSLLPLSHRLLIDPPASLL